MLNLSERRVVFLVGAVQFVNVLDFTMVMPLGPDFARALGIAQSDLGKLVAGYGEAAALAGFLGSFFLDRFDRRKALGVAMLGLVAGTFAGGLARSLGGLTIARVIAGAFGGPATSLAYAIIADVIPSERRGKAMGAVMGAFSVAQVLGVPAALLVSARFGWPTPFFAVGALGALVAVGTFVLLPPLTVHLEQPRDEATLAALLRRPTVLYSYTMTATLMVGGFLVIPNIPAYILGNLGYPRAHYWYLLAVGGTASFITLRLVGRLVDRYDATRLGALGVAASLPALYLFFVRPPAHLHVLGFYVAFLISFGARNVAYNALVSRVPRPRERARFLSIQSTVYHAAAGSASWLSTTFLRADARGRLVGMDRLALASMAIAACLPLLMYVVERRVRKNL